jgi:hypothetical protein
MGADCDRDAITRWVLRKAYRLRDPSADQIRNYQYWHFISRRDGFAGFEPDGWREWPWKPIPDGVTLSAIAHPEPASPPPTSPPEATETVSDAMCVTDAKPAKPHRRLAPQPLKRDPKLLERLAAEDDARAAEALLRRRLASASWPRSTLVTEARLAGISEAAIIAAASRLGVRIRDGRWTL